MRNRRYRKTIQNKLNAIKVNYDGQWFDSKKEAYRWAELKLLERSGQISDLKRQVKFILIPAQREPDSIGKRGGIHKGKLIERETAYIADFVYKENGKTIVEDTKGYKEGITYQYFVIKRKLMLYVHGIRIREV